MEIKFPESATLRERNKNKVRERIISAALKFSRQRGYENTSVEDILKLAEISKQTFYNYFASLDSVFREAASLVLFHFADTLKDHENWSGQAPDKLRFLYKGLGRIMKEDRPIWKAIFQANGLDSPRSESGRKSDEDVMKQLRGIIRDGQRKGELSTVFSAERLTGVVHGLQIRVCYEWALDFPGPQSLSKRLLNSLEIFLLGSLPR